MLTLGAFPLALVAPMIDRRIAKLYVPIIVFVAALSKLGHKEWRFVIYVVPWLNVGAAVTASVMYVFHSSPQRLV